MVWISGLAFLRVQAFVQAVAAPEKPTWAPKEELWESPKEDHYKELLERFEQADTNQ